MSQTQVDSNPFALMMDPAAVFAAIECSERLARLHSRICRPLDKPQAAQPAKPPPTTQMVPKIKPMSMTMPIALLAPSASPPACAKMGENPAVFVSNIVFMRLR